MLKKQQVPLCIKVHNMIKNISFQTSFPDCLKNIPRYIFQRENSKR